MHPLTASLLFLTWLASGIHAATLWTLGVPDESSAEFKPWFHPSTQARQIDFVDPSQDPIFEIGTSLPGNDWFAYQPGDANGQAGFRSHPFTIRFRMDSVSPGTHVLEIATLAYSARLPALEIQVNGRSGVFHQRPILAYSAGDNAVFFQPHYSTSLIQAAIPSTWLNTGTNTIVLIARDTPSDRDDTRPYGFPWPGSSGIVYDFLRLTSPGTTDLNAITNPDPRVVVTPFYRSKNDRLWQELEVDVPVHPGDGRIEVLLEIQGQTWRAEQVVNHPFGEVRLPLLVPDFSPSTEALLRLVKNGKEIIRDRKIQLTASRKWRLLVMPNAHLDVGYTDFAAKVSEIQSRSIERILEMSATRPDFRFTLDGFWIVEEFLHGRESFAIEPFLKKVKDGTISIPACYGSAFTGSASLENLIRSIYPSAQFAAEHGVPLNFALNTDVPSYSWSYASVLAAAGISHFLAASDAYRAPFLLYNRLNESSPHLWEGPDGGRVMTWLARHYHQGGSLFSFPPQVVAGRQSLDRFLQAYNHPEYRSDVILIYGTQVENVDLHPAQADLVAAWNQEYAFPRLSYAGFGEAMDQLKASLESNGSSGAGMKVVRGDGGPYWEDGLGANARVTALHRRNMQRILAAEVIGTMANRSDAKLKADQRLLQSAWQRLLLTDEHSWHADCSVREPQSIQSRRQGDEKDARTHEAARQIDALLSRGMSGIAHSIPSPPGTLVVFNSLSWARDGWVEWDVNRGTRIVDVSTGLAAPMEVLEEGRQIQRVRFLASQVPSVGYKIYSLRPGVGSPAKTTESNSRVIENNHYRIEIDPQTGAPRSLKDKSMGKEWIAPGRDWGLGEYYYVTGADELPNRLVQLSSVTPLPKLELHRATPDPAPRVLRSELGWEIQWTTQLEKHPRVKTILRLPDHARQIEFEHRITKEMSLNKEAAYLAFPFAMESPRFSWSTQNGWVDATRDRLPGASQEWFCMQEWITASASDGTAHLTLIPVDAPLMALGDIVRGTWPREFGQRAPVFYSYLMNNYTPEGYQAGQGGEFVFRTVLTSGKDHDPAAWYRLGRESQTPFEVNEITRNDKLGPGKGTLPSNQASFLDLGESSLSLVTWKRAEDGRGTVVRLLEVGGKKGTAEMVLPVNPAAIEAWECNALEKDLRKIDANGNRLRVSFNPFQILTVRLKEM